MYHQPEGAFTGEIAASMLCDLGCRYVILGHSERRHVLGEKDDEINKKVHAALAAGLTPIVCVGELLSEREAGQTAAVIRRQFTGSLAKVTAEQMAKIVIAYEPVWAIGTGKVATPAQAEEAHLDLRKIMRERYNESVAQKGSHPIWGEREARQCGRIAPPAGHRRGLGWRRQPEGGPVLGHYRGLKIRGEAPHARVAGDANRKDEIDYEIGVARQC